MIRARLTELNLNAALSEIRGARNYLHAAAVTRINKSCFVMPIEEVPKPNDTGTLVVHQEVTVQFRTLTSFIGASALADDDNDEIDTAREFLKNALIGFTPDEAISPIEFLGAGIATVDTQKSVIFYGVDFETRYHLRRT